MKINELFLLYINQGVNIALKISQMHQQQNYVLHTRPKSPKSF